MGRSRYKILDKHYPYFITSSLVTRIPLFNSYGSLVFQGLDFLVKERQIKIYAYVIMPDHIHIIAKGKDLAKHISSFKSYTARQIINELKKEKHEYLLIIFRQAKLKHKTDREHQVWSEGFHPKQISSDSVMRQKISYIHYNPVKAGLVLNELDWKYSSAGFYNDDSCDLALSSFLE